MINNNKNVVHQSFKFWLKVLASRAIRALGGGEVRHMKL